MDEQKKHSKLEYVDRSSPLFGYCRQLLLFPGGLDEDMQSGGLQVEFGFFLAAGDDLHLPEPKARRRRSLTAAPAYRLPPLFFWPTVCKVTQNSSEQFWKLSHVIADGCRFEVPSFDGIYHHSSSPLDSCVKITPR